MEIKNYSWLVDINQKKTYLAFCETFKVGSLSEIGKMLGFKNPYHSARQLFMARKPNRILRFAIRSARNIRAQEFENNVVMLKTQDDIKDYLDNLEITTSKIKENLL